MRGIRKILISISVFIFLINFSIAPAQQDIKRINPKELHNAFNSFNEQYQGKWKMEINQKTGYPQILSGFKTKPQIGDIETVTKNFLSENKEFLGVDIRNIKKDRLSTRAKFSHINYEQNYQGIPVEGSDVSVHLTNKNEIIAVFSNYIPDIDISIISTVSENTAISIAISDLRLKDSPLNEFKTKLVIFPDEKDGKHYLSYKVEIVSKNPIINWIYFIDAQTGNILLKYDNLRYSTSGAVQGTIYPENGSDVLQTVPFEDEYVYVNNTKVTTDSSGNYSTSATGSVSSLLQGPYVTVVNDDNSVGQYFDGIGIWTEVPYSLSTPHYYPNNYNNTIGTIIHSGAPYLKVHFSNFITENYYSSDLNCQTSSSTGRTCGDFVYFYDKNNNLVRYYLGNFGTFWSEPVLGDTVSIKLVSDPATNYYGFNIDKYSYFTPSSSQSPAPSWIWDNTKADIAEINAFYHINKIHNYYKNSFNFYGMDYPMMTIVNYGYQFLNAFYNPADKNIYFGEGDNTNSLHNLALASDVLYHEYTHGTVDHIYNLPYVGQSGAMSEALADYFAASFTNDSIISEWAWPAIQRNLSNTYKYPDNWVGEVHEDGKIYSGALWDVRTFLGQITADNIIFESLFFYPKDFSQGLEAVLLADDNDRDLNNGTPNKSSIENAFVKHGIARTMSQDTYEPNDFPYYAYGPLSSGSNYQSYIWYAFDYDDDGYADLEYSDFDYYKIYANTGSLNISLTNLPKDYNLVLYDQISSLAFSANSGTSNENISYYITSSGLYYILVLPATLNDYSTTQPYILKATFTPYNDTTPPTGKPSSPKDEGDVTYSRKIRFYWDAGTVSESESLITGYYLKVGTTPGGEDVFKGDVGNIYVKEIEVKEALKTYYAMVCGRNEFNLCSDFSDSSDGILVKDRIEKNMSSGVTMISIPINPENNLPSSIFSDFNLARWNPTEEKYHLYSINPNDSYLNISLGQGYFLKLNSNQSLNITGGLSLSSPYSIPLSSGWNQIGNPFNYNVLWDNNIKVKYGNDTKTISDAAGAGLVNVYLWTKIQGSWKLVHPYPTEMPTKYNPTNIIEPWLGYWIRAYKECDLIIQPIQGKTKEYLSSQTIEKDSIIKINAKTSLLVDTTVMGISQDTKGKNLTKPPKDPQPYIYIYSLSDNEKCAYISKEIQDTTVFDFVVEASEKNIDMEVNFELQNIPQDINLTLIDVNKRQEINLKETKLVKFKYEDSPYYFQIKAEKVKDIALGNFELLQVFTYPNPKRAGQNINFALETNTAGAKFFDSGLYKVKLEIYNLAGRKICDLDLGNNFVKEVIGNKVRFKKATKEGVDFPNLSNGVYIYKVVVIDEKGKTVVKKSSKIVILK